MQFGKHNFTTYSLILIPVLAAAVTGGHRGHKPLASYRFYNTHPGTQSTNRLDYVYADENLVSCVAYPTSYCRAVWIQGSLPVIGQPPAATAVFDFATPGGALFDEGSLK